MDQKSVADLTAPGPSPNRAAGNRGVENGLEMSQSSSLSSIDDIVSLILSTNPSSHDIQDVLLSSLLKIIHSHKGRGQRIFRNLLQDEVDPLSILDPCTNTLGFTIILGVRAIQCSTSDEARLLMPIIGNLSQVYDAAQWLGAGEIVTILVRGIVHIAQLVEDLVWANPSLLRILDGFRRLERGQLNLTTIHVIVLYHLLRTAHYETAMDWILQYDIVSADTKVTPLTYSDVLEYFYYGGLVSAKVGNVEKACHLLQICISTPAQAVSAIQIDAYKKLTLLHLLHNDELNTLPTYTSQAVLKAIRSNLANVEAYSTFVKAYKFETEIRLQWNEKGSTQNPKRLAGHLLQEVVRAKRDIFNHDQNMGLVQLLLEDYLPRRVSRLSKFVSHISIGEIVKLLQLEEDQEISMPEASLRILNALKRAQSMGWITVSIPGVADLQNLPSTVINFEQAPINVANGVDMAQQLMVIMKESHHWNKMVEEKERSIAESEAFLVKLINPSRSVFSGLSMDDFDEDAYL